MNKSTIEDLMALKETFLEKIRHIEEVLAISQSFTENSKTELVNTNSNTDSSAEKETYRDRVAKVLTTHNRFLHINEITEYVNAMEPHISRENVLKSVGTAKAKLLLEKAIVKVAVGAGNQNMFYGSHKWLNEDGSIKPAHIYNEALLKTKKTIEI